MTEQKQDRRKLHRVCVDVPAHIQIIFPEATFTPVDLRGVISDLTREGCRVMVKELSLSAYRKIMIGPRLCRVFCAFPTLETPARLFGKILNFEVKGKLGDGTCILGINFGENEDRDWNRLDDFLLFMDQA